MTRATVFCADPGLAHFGWLVIQARRDQPPLALAGGVLRTVKSDKKRGVRASADTSRRAQELAAALRAILEQWDPLAAAVEAMSQPRAASAAAKLARAWGVLDALLQESELATAEASPQAIKQTLCGRKDASKADVEAAVRTRIEGLAELLDALPKTRREHLADAGAAYLACEDAEVLRMARRLAR